MTSSHTNCMSYSTEWLSAGLPSSLPKWGRWGPGEAKLTPKFTAFLCVTVLHKPQTRRQNLFLFKISYDVFYLPILVAYDEGKNLWGKLCIQIEYGVLWLKSKKNPTSKSAVVIRAISQFACNQLKLQSDSIKNQCDLIPSCLLLR